MMIITKSLKYFTQSLILLRAVKYSVGHNIFLWSEVDDEEALKIAPRIIGGDESDPGDFPWHARQIRADGTWAGCGGSLVTNEYVLTAAHCVLNDTDTSQFQIGALCAPYEPGDNCGQTVETFGVIDIFVHPNYFEYTSEADYALIRLDGTSSIMPVTMDRGEFSPNYDITKNLLVSGRFHCFANLQLRMIVFPIFYLLCECDVVPPQDLENLPIVLGLTMSLRILTMLRFNL